MCFIRRSVEAGCVLDVHVFVQSQFLFRRLIVYLSKPFEDQGLVVVVFMISMCEVDILYIYIYCTGWKAKKCCCQLVLLLERE